ncbi:hypothetical protein GUITHDRAFT_111840 [Guillardia theta CCMP2712]|uniref:Uncharacterized protein n=1 Tax=Guillardia theta (strain CCMP2712) TaxID=905079 RepID=L1J1G6_GUITC|nr:hypothetical protein GUITHDRAFT_111840 [Guillardia theta CCMP2712]EKX41984.1 hypothetical protein GUITHDRAFT_111840 [Guillardia theta CCMP2712]|eukprot:XP_005828964.1 hypothetical protein GUITHDRAFT_111840 [Guillardia theta CCMP2712]
MPIPRHMRYVQGDLEPEEQQRMIKEATEKLKSDNDEDMCMAAESLYHMTSFTSGVSIDNHNAMTDYDKAVFLGKESSSTGENEAEQNGPVHVDGRRYMMGDGFMLMEDSTEEGAKADKHARRVAVMHSRSCIDNRVVIGKVEGIFEDLVNVMRRGSAQARFEACRAASQVISLTQNARGVCDTFKIAFRNNENKVALANVPGVLEAIREVLQQAYEDKDQKCITQACRVLGGIVSGNRQLHEAIAKDEKLIGMLRSFLEQGDEEASGQAGKVLNCVSAHIPL